MSVDFLNVTDFNQFEALNFVLQNLTTAPASPKDGQVYFDATGGVLTAKQWNGTEWVPFDARKLPAGTLPISVLSVDPLARANHTGTQLAATISDFNAAVRTNRLDQMAAPTAAVDMNGQDLSNLPANPATPNSAVSKTYADGILAAATGSQVSKGLAQVAVSTNVNLASPGATLDGVAFNAGDVVLLYGQTTGTENGPYTWTGPVSALTRAPNWDTPAEAVVGSYWVIARGTQADKFAIMTNDQFTLGASTLALTFTGAGTAYTAGSGILLAGNQFSLDTAIAVRKFNQTIGDGTSTAITVTHNLGTQDIGYFLRRVASPFRLAQTTVEAATVNTAILRFGTAPAANSLRVTIFA